MFSVYRVKSRDNVSELKEACADLHDSWCLLRLPPNYSASGWPAWNRSIHEHSMWVYDVQYEGFKCVLENHLTLIIETLTENQIQFIHRLGYSVCLSWVINKLHIFANLPGLGLLRLWSWSLHRLHMLLGQREGTWDRMRPLWGKVH